MSPLVRELLLKGLVAGTAVRQAKKTSVGAVYYGLAGGVGLIAFVSIVGIPWGKACFVIGQFAFFPFGKEAASREDLSGRPDCQPAKLTKE